MGPNGGDKVLQVGPRGIICWNNKAPIAEA